MLCARYSESSGVEVAGSREELRLLAGRVAKGADRVERLAERQPEPYDRALTRIELRNRGRALKVSVEGDTLVVSGDQEALCLLSQNLSFFADRSDPDDAGAHIHIEWFPGHVYIAEDSEPVVITYEGA